MDRSHHRMSLMHHRSSVVQSRSSMALVDALNVEWPSVVRAAADAVSAWADRHAALRGCRDLDDVLLRVRQSADPVLHALLVEAHSGCRFAARAVLQTMLGKLVVMAGRTAGTAMEDFAVALWGRILAYPLQRRPRSIAANLALDALKDARQLARDRSRPVELSLVTSAEDVDALRARSPEARMPTARELIAAAVEADIIATASAAVLVSVYVDGLSSRHAAERHGMTPELVRYRCSHATGKIRNQISEVLAAA